MAEEKQPEVVADSHSSSLDGEPLQTVQLDELPAGYYRSKNFIGSVVGVCLMAISLYLGFVLPSNSLSTIDEELGPDPNYTMISTAFTLVAGVCLLIVGRLGDVLGRRYFLIGGQVIGMIGGIVCATAHSIPTVIGGSVLTGIAGAVQLTFTFVIAELVPNKARPIVNAGLFVVTFPFASFGPVIAHDLVEHTTKQWRWSYWMNVITCGISALLFLCFYFPPGYKQLHHGQKRWAELKKLDYIGLILYSGGLVCVFLGISWGGSSYPWHSAHVVATLVIGFVTLVVFVIYECFTTLEQPLLPVKLLRNRNYVAVVASACVGNIIYFSMNVLWPSMVSILFTTDSIEAGWLECTTGVAVVVGEIVAGLLMKPIGHHRWQLVGCTVGMTTFLGAIACVNQYRRSYGVAFTILGGLAVGYQELICIIMVALICDPSEIGYASGFLGSWKQVCGSIATSIYVAILDARITKTLPANVTPAVTKAGLPAKDLTALYEAIAEGTTSAIEAVPGMNTKVLVALGMAEKTAYSQAFKTVFLTSIAFGGLSIIAALFSRSIDDRFNNEIAKTLGRVEPVPSDSSKAAAAPESDLGEKKEPTEVA